MFTGIIQGPGIVQGISRFGSESRLTIAPSFPLPDIIDGESIAVNGACLSVEQHSGSVFSVYASGETLSRTTLGSLGEGSLVNLERALAVGDRLGGHIVSGHVDCIAEIESIAPAGASLCVRLRFPADLAAEVVEKGSVCLDGISLTINACGSDWLEVNIIPDTQKRTTMRRWQQGSRVNMETDVLAKYVRRLLSTGGVRRVQEPEPAKPEKITREYLLENGFL